MSCLKLAVLFSAALHGSLAKASDWAWEFPSQSVSTTRFQTEAARGAGLFYVDASGQLLTANHSGEVRERVDRFAAQHTVVPAYPWNVGGSDRRWSTLTAPNQLADSRVVVARHDPLRQIRWQEALNIDRRRMGVAADAAGTTWLTDGDGYLRFGPDGIRRSGTALSTLGMNTLFTMVGDVRGGGAVFFGAPTPPSASPREDMIISLDGEGRHRWTWVDPLGGDYSFIQRTATDDTILWGQVGTEELHIVRLDPTGQVRWRHRGVPRNKEEFAVLIDGSLVLHTIDTPTGTARLAYYDPEGVQRWQLQRTIPTGATPGSAMLSAHPLAGIVVAEGFGRPRGDFRVIERLALSGDSIWRLEPETTELFGYDIQVLSDGEVLGSRNGQLYQLDRAAARFVPRTLSTALLDSAALLASDAAADGTLAVSIRHASTTMLSTLSASGQPRWQQDTGQRPYVALALARSGRVCGLRSEPNGLSSNCLDAAQGTALASVPIVLPLPAQVLAQTPSAGAEHYSVLLQYGVGTSNAGLQWIRVGLEDGAAMQRELGLGSARFGRLAADGEGVLLTAEAVAPQLVRTAADGSVRYRMAAASFGEVLDAAALAGGRTLLRARRFPTQELVLLDGTGNVVTRHPVAATAFEQLLATASGNTVVAVGLSANGASDGGRAPVWALDAVTGQLRWRNTVPAQDHRRLGKLLQPGADAESIWWGSALRQSYELLALDLENGEAQAARVLGAAADGQLAAVHLTAGHQLLRLFHVQVPHAPSRLHATGHQDAAPSLASTVDAVSRTGAWYDPASSGQGWFLEVFPSSRTLYAAWFTYQSGAGIPGNAPARLRWYSLQGTYAPGATEMTLDVLENRGGEFAAPPGTAPRKIGSATLRFEACHQAVLDYVLTEADGIELRDRVALEALAVRSGDCAQPLAPATSGNGFTGAASGAWYNVATPGQGLVGVVQAPTAQQAGLLFAGWFHYDPAGQVDDPLQQSWLTLQGPLLPTSKAGEAKVEIYRTLGGRIGGPTTANTTRLGAATVTLEGCDRMRLAWRFDDTELAGAYRNLSGSMDLVRVAACVP